MSHATDDDQGAADAFDLTALLWGDHPIATPDMPAAAPAVAAAAPAEPTPFPTDNGFGVPSTPLVEPYRYPAPPDLISDVATTQSIAEPPPTNGVEASPIPESDEDDGGVFADDLFLELPDLDALLALGDDGADEDDLGATPLLLGERELGLTALTERLHREVLPRLRGYIASRGYLTLGHLGYAVAALQGSEVHLAEVRAFVQRSDVPVLPSRAHGGVRQIPLVIYDQAKLLFGDLLRGEPDEAVVIERLGYSGLDLSEGTRRFLMQAWIGHCLSCAEERAHAETIAAEIARTGDRADLWSADALAAREALILDNLWLVARMARKYVGRGVDIDDLHQMGALGLFRAVERFDVARSNRLVSYASSWVMQSITRYIADHSHLIRLPVHLQEHRKRVQEVASELQGQTGRTPSVEEIAARGDVSAKTVHSLLVLGHPVSVDDPRLRPRIVRGLRTTDDDLLELVLARGRPQAIAEVLKSLSQREAEVLQLRFGLFGQEKQTLEEIGRTLGVTRERIRQIEAKALKKLNHPSRKKRLAAYDPRLPDVTSKRSSRKERGPSLAAPKAQTFVNADKARGAKHTWPDRRSVTIPPQLADELPTVAPSTVPSPPQTMTDDANDRSNSVPPIITPLLDRAALRAVRSWLEKLKPLPRRIVELRLGLNDRPKMSFHEAVVHFDVSETLVRCTQDILLGQMPNDQIKQLVAQALSSNNNRDGNTNFNEQESLLSNTSTSSSILTGSHQSQPDDLSGGERSPRYHVKKESSRSNRTLAIDLEERFSQILIGAGSLLSLSVSELVLRRLVRPHSWRDVRYVGVSTSGTVSAWRGQILNFSKILPRYNCAYIDYVTNDLPVEERIRLLGDDFAQEIFGLDEYVVAHSSHNHVRSADDVKRKGFTPRLTARGFHVCMIYSLPIFTQVEDDSIYRDVAELVHLCRGNQDLHLLGI